MTRRSFYDPVWSSNNQDPSYPLVSRADSLLNREKSGCHSHHVISFTVARCVNLVNERQFIERCPMVPDIFLTLKNELLIGFVTF